MQALCASRPPEADDSFAARARVAIEYADTAQRLPLARLDRQGLVAYLTDDACLPPLGLPVPARVLSGDETLCELRLVARSVARSADRGERAIELTLQPSRADDDAAFWQALYEHLRRHRSPTDGPRPTTRNQGPACREKSGTGLCPSSALDIGCEAVFTLSSHDEARFFSEWLEYHFAEIAARSRVTLSSSELRAIERRAAGSHVGVFFSYRWGGQAMVQCTSEICGWVASELDRLFGLTARFEVVDTREGIVLPGGAHRPASLAS